jgi:DNA mismatch endonuclease (patch repair protein)
MDVFTKKKRSAVMAAIRGRGNRSTERTFAALLRCARLRGWTLHSTEVVGKPDFYFRESRVAVFVDGCFWHGCPKCFRAPRQNANFWAAKISRNRKRDRTVGRVLRRQGVRVFRIWEHDVEARSQKIERVMKVLKASI